MSHMAVPASGSAFWTRPRIHVLNRSIILLLFSVSMGSYLFLDAGIVDVLLRTYVMFLCTVMAHEGSHGHLGPTRRSNDWWGRIALFTPMVPYVSFRKTHRMHHARTNVPGEDPDIFIKPRHWFEVPFRSVAIPHYWLFWLKKRGWLTREDQRDLLLTYVALFGIYTPFAFSIGVERFVLGAFPSLFLVSLLLWYPFAVKTHEGFSLGSPEERSHNYYGYFAYWFSLGLSMHRVHHLRPSLSWIEILPHVERKQGGLSSLIPFRRDVRVARSDAAS
jgi:fatty acid desaturase